MSVSENPGNTPSPAPEPTPQPKLRLPQSMHEAMNEHPSRTVQRAQHLARLPEASEEVRYLAAMVHSLAKQVNDLKSQLSQVSSTHRRFGIR